MPRGIEAQLRGDRRRGLRRVVLGVLTPVVIFVVLFVALVLVIALKVGPAWLSTALSAALFIAPLIAAGIGFLAARDGMRLWHPARRDLKRGTIEQFVMDPVIKAEVDEERSRARMHGQELAAIPEHLVVLPASMRLVSRDGEPLKKFEPVHVAVLARVREDAVFEPVAMQDEPGSSDSRPGSPAFLRSHATAQRALSTAELGELRRFSRRLHRTWIYVPVPLALSGVAVAAVVFRGLNIGNGIASAFWLTALVFALFSLVQSMRIWRKVRRDLALGLVYVLDIQTLKTFSESEEWQGDPSSLEGYAEFLAGSGMHWTLRDIPAPWRAAAQSRKS